MTIIITEYAVRIKGTQRYLPRPQRRDGRGGSHLEPVDFADRSSWPKNYDKYMQIRSYPEKRAAKNLLTAWLKGAVGCDRGYDYEDYYEENYLIPKPHRHAEDMEIVEIVIILPI
jgi:hypothetical protein